MTVEYLLELLNDFYEPSDTEDSVRFKETTQSDVLIGMNNKKAFVPYNDRLVNTFYSVGSQMGRQFVINLIDEDDT